MLPIHSSLPCAFWCIRIRCMAQLAGSAAPPSLRFEVEEADFNRILDGLVGDLRFLPLAHFSLPFSTSTSTSTSKLWSEQAQLTTSALTLMASPPSRHFFLQRDCYLSRPG
ncbi:hypothetical protein CC85DRAFT_43703 [Cutaneotrichosporon oleaginosum]|uniref:Uncharacterized protein n=1 Tax=Cutaneotrichosporon oleaginosum TaxID=879819 RepID=A0A0J0XRR5_9TREE|nr:uncharacterized protein CC85DRAFT_43703 [Cutaneotrichosporon oleaginosum]KLT43783.1 hypothetical protein CC85DRAFT_43703 [Cutaneotrichosporon oleaginosum]TXT05198.1 hypothetical protein COLE_06518 [Cutaneotrichosporon oleaginosum]